MDQKSLIERFTVVPDAFHNISIGLGEGTLSVHFSIPEFTHEFAPNGKSENTWFVHNATKNTRPIQKLFEHQNGPRDHGPRNEIRTHFLKGFGISIYHWLLVVPQRQENISLNEPPVWLSLVMGGSARFHGTLLAQ